MLAAVVEQRRFFRDADQSMCKRARLNPPVLIELAEVRHRLLDHPPSNERCAPSANSGEPYRPSCELYGASTCAI